MYKHLSCVAVKIKLTTGSGNAGMCEKLRDRSRILIRQKAGVCASTVTRTPDLYCIAPRQVKIGGDCLQIRRTAASTQNKKLQTIQVPRVGVPPADVAAIAGPVTEKKLSRYGT
jgi:hypothetical protein